MNPQISVIMSVYNTPKKYLTEAIESVLNQTYQNFEFIIVDDNSNDEVKNVLATYMDNPKICILVNNENKGLTRNMNACLEIANGDYIARMDSDDVCMPDRLKKQLEFMEKNKNVTVLGCYVQKFSHEGSGDIYKKFEQNQDKLKTKMLFYNAGVVHPTAFIRREFLRNYNIKYNEKMVRSQDYGLWVDILCSNGQIRVIPEVLLKYRVHEGQVTNTQSKQQQQCVELVMYKLLDNMNCINDEKEMVIHKELHGFKHLCEPYEYEQYINKLIKSNKKTKIYDNNVFKIVIYSMWFKNTIKALVVYHDIRFLFMKLTIKSLILPIYYIRMFFTRKKKD